MTRTRKGLIGMLVGLLVIGGFVEYTYKQSRQFSVSMKAEPSLHKPLLKIENWITESGAVVSFVSRKEIPMIDLVFRWKASPRQEKRDQAGLANLTHLVLENGPASLSTAVWMKGLEAKGIIFQTGITNDYTQISFRLPSDPAVMQEAFLLIQNYLGSPAFRTDDVKQAQDKVLRMLEIQKQVLSWVTHMALQKALYGESAYGRPIEGFPETVKKIEMADVETFFKENFSAPHLSLAVVGDLSEEVLKSWADKWSAVLPAAVASSPQPEYVTEDVKKRYVIDFPSPQMLILAGTKVLKRDDPDATALSVAQKLFGNNGMQDRLFQNIRKKEGLAYGPRSFLTVYQDSGFFGLSAQTQNARAQEALTLLKRELELFREEGPTEEELEAFKKAAVGRMQIAIATNEGAVAVVADQAFYRLPVDYFDQKKEQIQKLSTKELRSVFQKYVHVDDMVWIEAGH
jgi:zinc protease